MDAVKPLAAELALSVSDDLAVGGIESVFDFVVILAAPWTGGMRVEITNGHGLLFCVLDTPQEKREGFPRSCLCRSRN